LLAILGQIVVNSQTPFEWATEHIQLIGWPALLILAGKFTWTAGRFLVRQELQVEADRAKLTEAHDSVEELKQVNSGLLAEWKAENGILKDMVTSMMTIQRDFHDHTIEDKFVMESVKHNQDTIIKNLEDHRSADREHYREVSTGIEDIQRSIEHLPDVAAIKSAMTT